MKRSLLVSCLFSVIFSGLLFAELQIPDRHEKDESERKTFVLDNGLKVILVSDPKFNVSAASLDVSVGSLSDPRNRQGLAHFLEHMLFLGTKKYPDVDEYSRYLKARGGYSNAFTAGNHTNYQFQIQHDGFEGALDRFAQFFIAPLFNPDYTNREVNAVNSEHEKNLMDDMRRRYQLVSMFYRKDHPANHFSTGNSETLKGITGSELKEFYELHYSANRMALCLLSNKSISWMETRARKMFSEVKNKKLEKIKYEPDFLSELKKLRLLQIEPVKDLRQLNLSFRIPSTWKHYRSKPTGLIGFCIGHEGEGSLLSLLKREGLATGLGAGAYSETDSYGSFSISVYLTQKGLKEYRKIMNYCFAYIEMLKKEGLKDHIFEEEQTMSQMNEIYTDKGEGMDRAISLASSLNSYPIEDAHRVNYILDKKDPKLFSDFLSYLRPDNMFVILMAKGLKTDKVSPIYGTKYSYTELDDEAYQSLFKVTLNKELAIPKANPFLPKNAMVLSHRPTQILNEEGVDIWYLQDSTFRRPKVSMIFSAVMPKSQVSVEQQVLVRFYEACIREQLNELSYPASLAGLHYSVSGDLEGMNIAIGGYNDSAVKLLSEVLSKLKTINVTEERFAAIKDDIIRSLKNFPKNQAYEIVRSIARDAHLKTYFSPEKLAAPSEVMTLDKVKAYAKTAFSNVYLKGLIHGNMSKSEALSVSGQVRKSLASRPLKLAESFNQEYLSIKSGSKMLIEGRLVTNNSCFRRDVILGEDTPAIRMGSAILSNFITQPFFTEMRTNQQLGYIVWAGASGNELNRYLVFIIQSGTYPADILRDRAHAFIATFPEKMEKLSDAGFETLKGAVRKKLMEKSKSIGEKAGEFYDLTFEKNRDFNRLQDNLKALEKITKGDVLKMLKEALDPKTQKSVDFLMYAKEHQPKGGKELKATKVEELKASAVYKKK